QKVNKMAFGLGVSFLNLSRDIAYLRYKALKQYYVFAFPEFLNIHCAGTLKIVNIYGSGIHGAGWSMNFSALIDAGAHMNIGIVLKDFLPTWFPSRIMWDITDTSEEFRPAVKLAMSVSYGKRVKILHTIEAESVIKGDISGSLGSEACIKEMFFLRAGAALGKSSLYYTAGLGVVFKGFNVDYALKITPGLPLSHFVSAGYNF
ncbi:MAG TPA: hypothetical protein VKS21_01200, partial [Spirochaetota bacterium]|nr:hypothetical protein [Spirochaetota bacterium]